MRGTKKKQYKPEEGTVKRLREGEIITTYTPPQMSKGGEENATEIVPMSQGVEDNELSDVPLSQVAVELGAGTRHDKDYHGVCNLDQCNQLDNHCSDPLKYHEIVMQYRQPTQPTCTNISRGLLLSVQTIPSNKLLLYGAGNSDDDITKPAVCKRSARYETNINGKIKLEFENKYPPKSEDNNSNDNEYIQVWDREVCKGRRVYKGPEEERESFFTKFRTELFINNSLISTSSSSSTFPSTFAIPEMRKFYTHGRQNLQKVAENYINLQDVPKRQFSEQNVNIRKSKFTHVLKPAIFQHTTLTNGQTNFKNNNFSHVPGGLSNPEDKTNLIGGSREDKIYI